MLAFERAIEWIVERSQSAFGMVVKLQRTSQGEATIKVLSKSKR